MRSFITFSFSLLFTIAALAQSTSPPQNDLKHPPVNQEFIALPDTAAKITPVEHKDLVYLRASGTDLQLDVYQQPSGKPAPVLVYFHGGAWWKNARPKSAAGFHSLLSMGFSLVTVDYRLTGVAPAPAAIQDARCALSWVKNHAGEYNFDLNKVIVFGTSSGGHQALMAGMLPPGNSIDLAECRDQPRVSAIFDFYGISDVRELLGDGFTLKKSTTNWIGNAPDPVALATQMSPLNYIRPGLPPTFIVHGDADPVVPYEQSLRLRDALIHKKVPVELFTVSGGEHGKFTADQSLAIGATLSTFLKNNRLLP
jgi:acetyl esterase/lipase